MLRELIRLSKLVVEAALLRRELEVGEFMQREAFRIERKAEQRRQVKDAEDRIEEAVAPMFEQQFDTAAKKLKGASGDNADKLLKQIFNPRDWDKELVDLALPAVAETMLEGAKSSLAAVGVHLPKKGKDTELESKASHGPSMAREKVSTATEWLESEGTSLSEGMTFDTPDGPIDIALATEYPEWLKDKIGEELTETFDQDYWAGMNDTTKGRLHTILNNGLESGKSITTMAAEIAGLGEKFSKQRGRLIGRTECLPGDTVVNGANVLAVYRRWYSGPFIEVITKAGRKFSGTPNHPMLTTRGWVGLGNLQESDDLVCYDRFGDKSGASGDVDVEKPPSTIDEIFHSFASVGIFERRRATEVDFHGDGIDGNVDVFATNGELAYGYFVPIKKSGIENVFTESDVREILLVTEGVAFSRDKLAGFTETADCSPRSNNMFSDTGIIDVVCVGDISRRFTTVISSEDIQGVRSEFGMAAKSCGEQQSARFRMGSDEGICENASPSHNGRVTMEDGSNLSETMTGQIEIDHPLLIRRIEFWCGHVFNLMTREGYFIIADGAYTGNSAHALNGGRDASIEGLKEAVGPEVSQHIGKSWLSVLGDTTRDDHANLDGVLADEEGMWSLGGVRIPWPGHVSLPAGQRCNCMCTILTELGVGAPQAEVEGAVAEQEGVLTGAEKPKPKPEEEPKPKPKPVDDRPFDQRQADWEDELNKKQLRAIDRYTGDDYTKMRNCLNRNVGCTKSIRAWNRDMKEALEGAPEFEGKVYRGLSFESKEKMADFAARVQRDGELTDKGFLSTSTDIDVATGFAGEPKESVLLIIKSKRGASVKKLSAVSGESEVVLQPGAKLKLIKAGKNKFGRTLFIMEEQ